MLQKRVNNYFGFEFIYYFNNKITLKTAEEKNTYSSLCCHMFFPKSLIKIIIIEKNKKH